MSQRDVGRLRNQHLGFVYQFHHLLPEFSALENIAMPLLIGGMNKKEALDRAAVLLNQVSLEHRSRHHPGALSGGERQRVAIARALVATPAVVLADEPTGNLDEASATQVHELMLKLAAQMGVAFVVVTHNNQFAGRMQKIRHLHGGILEQVS
jgi:lipoprotein-releasing system ATP-binding protein